MRLTLIKILTVHHFDVTNFFEQISNQQSNEPFFDMAGKITYAQNNKDLMALNSIKVKIQNGGEPPLWLKYRPELAYAWVLRSNDQVSPEMKKRIKGLIVNENWDRTSYHFLSQAVIFLDIDDAKRLVDTAYAAYRKHPAVTLQFVALIAVNYLNCYYHHHVDKSYGLNTFKFLHELPAEPAIGLNKLLGLFYEVLFDHNVKEVEKLKQIISDCGYGKVIDDIEG